MAQMGKRVVPKLMMTSATGNKKALCAAQPRQGGFSLIELLTVIVIMALIMGVVGVGITGMSRPGLQTGASQVASGMSLARQLAISKNTYAAFIIATTTGAGMPSQPYKYWAVAVSNRATANWSLQKDWERLPEGAVFWEIPNNYKTITNNDFTATVGTPSTPSFPSGTNSFTGYYGTTTNVTFTFSSLPAIIFKPNGAAKSSGPATAVRLADGAVDGGGNVILRNTNRYFFVETDSSVGRIRVRTPESYRQP